MVDVDKINFNLEPLAKFSDLIPDFNKFSSWVKETFTPNHRKEIEEYLATSVDVYDLERKITLLYRRGIV
jgi:hypothetical protein